MTAAAGGNLRGEIQIPGDKSISHRAVMLGSLAEGITEIRGCLQGEDPMATLQAFRAMGVRIDGPEEGCLVVHGVGLHGLKQPLQPLYLGNSGTSMRLLSGLLAAQPFDTVLTGDDSLSGRPMRRITEPLSAMGARIGASEAGTPPLSIEGGRRLKGIDYPMPVASAQVKSCLLLAGLYAEGRTCVVEPDPSRDHTERMLQGFGYVVERDNNTVCLQGGGTLKAAPVEVPGDISSAALFMVGAAISEASDVLLKNVGVNPTRTGIITILRQMGADIALENEREAGAEPVADIRVRGSRLQGIAIPEHLVPLAIDEFPALFVAAACAEGETVLTGARELRVKESDRIQVMADGLAKLGIEALPTEDGIVIQGGQMTGGAVDSRGDHRIAMAFAMAGLRSSSPVLVHDCANVKTSFPDFIESAWRLGMTIKETAW